MKNQIISALAGLIITTTSALAGVGGSELDYPSHVIKQNCVVFDLEHGANDYTNLTYAWDFGDGQSGTGIQTEHCYTTAGEYNVQLSIIDPETGTVFHNEYKVAVEITPLYELVIKQHKNENGKIILSADLLSAEEIAEPQFFWDINGMYYIGNAPEVELEEGTEIRLMSLFENNGEEISLSENILAGN